MFLHCPLHTDVIPQDRAPAHQHARGGQIHQPVEDGQRVVVERKEAQEHERRKQRHAHVRGAPAGRPQEDLGRLTLQREAVEHTRARKQALVAAAPGAGDDDGVDQAGDRADPRGAGRDDEGGLSGGAALVAQAGVVAGHQHADDEDGEYVKQEDAGENLLTGTGDGATRVLGLGGGHGDGLNAGKGENGRGHDAPEAQEFSPVARGDILDEGAWGLPVKKPNARGARDAAQVNDEAENDEEDNEKDLEDSEEILDFTEDWSGLVYT